MDAVSRIETALSNALQCTDGTSCPPKLAAAMQHAVFPRGARVRPRLCLAVAAACGEDNPTMTDAAASAIELLHCASLVHDDLPCFDNADMRRALPTVHRAFGEPLAVLAGDALIVLAFQNLGRLSFIEPQRMGVLLSIVARAVGAPGGIVAGQAWECEPKVDLVHYHRAKTASLFVAATCAGAAATGRDPDQWALLGETLGEAYQVADDLRDAVAGAEEIGKLPGRDVALDRPSATRELGIEGAMSRLDELVRRSIASIPNCRGAADLRALIMLEAKRLVPKSLARHAA